MHKSRRKKFFTLPVLKSEAKIWIFLLWQTTSLKSKFPTQASIILSRCKRNATSNCALNLIVIGQKSYSTFKSASYWPKKRSARPSTHTIAPFKRGDKVLDPLLPSSWPVTFVKLDRELFLKQSCQSIVKKCLKKRPSTCENVMFLRK